MALVASLAMILMWFAAAGAWITHIIWSIQMLRNDNSYTIGKAVLAAIGAFMPPIGVTHGFMIWFGLGA